MSTEFIVRIGKGKYLRLDGLYPYDVRSIGSASRFTSSNMAIAAARLTAAVTGEPCNVESIYSYDNK